MLDVQELQIMAQLVDNLEISYKNLESAYNSKNSEAFMTAKRSILDTQSKIDSMIK